MIDYKTEAFWKQKKKPTSAMQHLKKSPFWANLDDQLEIHQWTLTPNNFAAELPPQRFRSISTHYTTVAVNLSAAHPLSWLHPISELPQLCWIEIWEPFWVLQWQIQLLNCRWLELCDMVRYLAGNGWEKICVPSGHWGDGHGQQQYCGASTMQPPAAKGHKVQSD